MAQQLIVEGNDAFVLAQICIQRKMNPPKGYESRRKFEKFIVQAQGISKIELAIQEALRKPEVSNIGIVVDTNDKGPQARFTSLKSIIEKEISNFPFSEEIDAEGFHHKADNLSIGIWVMPDNINKGYLEHFVAKLVPSENGIWDFATKTIDELKQKPFCEFTEAKEQKALVHTYLAWQKSPGLPLGTAIRSNYFDANSPHADNFVAWFENTFELGE